MNAQKWQVESLVEELERARKLSEKRIQKLEQKVAALENKIETRVKS